MQLSPGTSSSGGLASAADRSAEVDLTALRANGTRLLIAGFAGSQVLGLCAVVVLGAIHGRAGAVSAALGAVVVVLYRVIGQWITIRAAGRPVTGQFMVAMTSLMLRVGALTVLLVLWWTLPPDVTSRFVPLAIGLGVLGAEIGWLGALLVSGFRTRVPVYDTPSTPPVRDGGAR